MWRIGADLSFNSILDNMRLIIEHEMNTFRDKILLVHLIVITLFDVYNMFSHQD